MDGTLAVERSTLEFTGNFSFENNKIQDLNKNGGGIYATLECTVILSGNGSFINNMAKYGGGIYLDQMSVIKILPQTTLQFERNKAAKGAAIFIQTSSTQVNRSSLPCLFQLPNGSVASDISFNFTHNKGNPGASILHANIKNINYNLQRQTFTALNNLQEILPSLPDSTNTEPYYYSDSFLFCFCTKDSKQNCDSSRHKNITAFKGKPFFVSVRVIKFYGSHINEPVRSNLNSSLLSQDNNSTVESTLKGCFQKLNNERCTDMEFAVITTDLRETVLLNIGESFLDKEKTLYLDIMFDSSCPLGFELNQTNNTCTCDSNIMGYLEICDLAEEMFQKKSTQSDFWMGPSNNNISLEYYQNCPHGYCITNHDGKFSPMLIEAFS